jgi:hypothetical protein
VLTITADEARALPEQGSAMAERMRHAKTTRRMKRFGQSMRDRWDRR